MTEPTLETPLAGHCADLRIITDTLQAAPAMATEEADHEQAAFLLDQWRTRLAEQDIDPALNVDGLWWEFTLPQDILDQIAEQDRRLSPQVTDEEHDQLLAGKVALASLVRAGHDEATRENPDEPETTGQTVIVELDLHQDEQHVSSTLEFFTGGHEDPVLEFALLKVMADTAAFQLHDLITNAMNDTKPTPVSFDFTFTGDGSRLHCQIHIVAGYDGDQDKIDMELATRDGKTISPAREELLAQFASRHHAIEYQRIALGEGSHFEVLKTPAAERDEALHEQATTEMPAIQPTLEFPAVKA